LQRSAFFGVPVIQLRIDRVFDAGAADLHGGCEETIFNRPRLWRDHDHFELFVIRQVFIDLFEQFGHFVLHLRLDGGVTHLGTQVFSQHNHGVGRNLTDARHQRQLDHRMGVEHVLNGRRCHVLALGCFEQFFDAAGDLEQTIAGTTFTTVTRFEIAVCSEGFFRQVRALVIAHHAAGGLDLDFAFVADAHLYARQRHADAAGGIDSGRGVVRVGKVFGHAVAFDQVQAEAAVPSNQLCGNRCRAAAGHFGVVQAQALEHLVRNNATQNGHVEQFVELFGRLLGKHTLLEFEPQARHRDEDGWLGPVQVFDKSFQCFSEVHMDVAIDQRCTFNPGALKHVRQRQVGHHAVLAFDLDAVFQLFDHAFGSTCGVLEAVHHAFGLSGGARGVDDHGDVGGRTVRAALHRGSARHDRVPGFVFCFWCEGECNAGQTCGYAGGLLVPGVELADEQQAGTAVLQHVFHSFGGFGRENRDGGVACHPDGELRHKEVRAIFGQNGNA
jgi:hypothetical protein